MLAVAPAAAESERLVAWLRLPAVALIGLGESVDASASGGTAFFLAMGVFAVWSAGLLIWVHSRRITEAAALVTTAVDVGAITALAVLSGGGFSQARFAYALVPIAVAFRFRPALTAVAGAASVLAYLAQSLSHPTRARGEAGRFIALQTGYLIWISVAAVLLAMVLARRTRRVGQLVVAGRHLLVDALGAEERERQALAEGLHDSAIQNLLSARHDLQEASEAAADRGLLLRAETAITETVSQLREVVSELHPLVLEQAGLEAALSAAAQQASRRGGFRVHVEFTSRQRHLHERVLLAAARELLANVAEHARAHDVQVRCSDQAGWLVLTVADDGDGFDTSVLSNKVATGHIGLASQNARVEGAGGTLTIESEPGQGTVAIVRLPARSGADTPAPSHGNVREHAPS